MSTGVPIKLLHESKGHTVSIELKTGQTYRGLLFDAEDNMNCQLRGASMTTRDGKVSHLEQVYLRGSHIRFFVVPDMLRQAPMFQRVGPGALKGRGVGMGRGVATIARSQAARGRGGPPPMMGRGGPPPPFGRGAPPPHFGRGGPPM